jgi:V8-like Glu-specific endopeptidase
MKLKPFTLVAMLSATIISSSTIAANQPLISKSNENISATLSYWTPENMRDAKPMDMPKMDYRLVKELSIEEFRLQQEGSPAVSKEGAPPTVKATPDLHPLFKPVYFKSQLNKEGGVTTRPENYGSLNAQFSSSRLVPVTADLTYPYSAVGKLFFTIPGSGNYVCSASVIANRIVLTAGHCVHKGSGGTASGYYTNWLFVPAYRSGAAPFQKWTWSHVQTTESWANGNRSVPNSADYGMLEMQDQTINGKPQQIANVTGKLGYATQKLIPNHAHMLGYPCNFDSCQLMHQVTAQSFKASSANNVEYGSDSQGGSSGGPWIQNFGIPSTGQKGGVNPTMNQVIAVTSYGYTNPAFMVQGAANFNDEFTTLINSMCSLQAGNC